MILWSIVGIAVGVLMGLTGSGGAMISIPLFIYAGKYTLHQSTVFALYCVLAGAALNFYFQRKNSDWLTSILLSVFSGPGSWFASLFKPSLPEIFLKILFIAVCTLSLARIWKKNMAPSAISRERIFGPTHFFLSIASGFCLGILVTLTGLGGGVVLVPLLMGVFGLNMGRATATSLMTVMVSSIISLTAQYYHSVQSSESLPVVAPESISLMLLGTLISALWIKKWTERFPPARLDGIRKYTMSAVIGFSVISLVLK